MQGWITIYQQYVHRLSHTLQSNKCQRKRLPDCCQKNFDSLLLNEKLCKKKNSKQFFGRKRGFIASIPGRCEREADAAALAGTPSFSGGLATPSLATGAASSLCVDSGDVGVLLLSGVPVFSNLGEFNVMNVKMFCRKRRRKNRQF
jgi:hypothetical protein